MKSPKRVAVIGSGPAGLMAATHAQKLEFAVTVFERRPGLGRKLLIAGSSGLNISYDATIDDFLDFYTRRDPQCDARLLRAIRNFPSEDWLEFVKKLGSEVFVGSSRRWFVREMKASQLLSNWVAFLKAQGVEFKTGFEVATREDLEELRSQFDAVILAMGGGSWEETPPSWPELLRSYGIQVREFEPSNVGYELKAPTALFEEAQGKPIKNCVLTTRLGSKQGELVLTRYGLEGTPIYFLGTPGEASLNLKPEQSPQQWLATLQKPLRENLSPLRRIKKLGGLSEAALALLYHLTDSVTRSNLESLAFAAQNLSLTLLHPRPLEEAISSRGGVDWSELGENLMLKKLPQVYCAGEMIAWDAPTGGFLIQGSVALGAAAARGLGATLSPVKSG